MPDSPRRDAVVPSGHEADADSDNNLAGSAAGRPGGDRGAGAEMVALHTSERSEQEAASPEHTARIETPMLVTGGVVWTPSATELVIIPGASGSNQIQQTIQGPGSTVTPASVTPGPKVANDAPREAVRRTTPLGSLLGAVGWMFYPVGSIPPGSETPGTLAAEGEGFSPWPDTLSESLPVDLSHWEEAFQRYLDEVDRFGREVGDLLEGEDLYLWVGAAMVTVAAGEFVRRRAFRSRPGLSHPPEGDDEISWWLEPSTEGT